jgi:hypothetical protein
MRQQSLFGKQQMPVQGVHVWLQVPPWTHSAPKPSPSQFTYVVFSHAPRVQHAAVSPGGGSALAAHRSSAASSTNRRIVGVYTRTRTHFFLQPREADKKNAKA